LQVKRGPNWAFGDRNCYIEGALAANRFGGGLQAAVTKSGQGDDHPSEVVTHEPVVTLITDVSP
jgi:hypothetical protein